MTEEELMALALDYHKNWGEGEYGCPGATCPGVERLSKLLRLAVDPLLVERDAARKSAEFQRRRADRGWFLYERTVTEFINFKESMPDDDVEDVFTAGWNAGFQEAQQPDAFPHEDRCAVAFREWLGGG
jgi:hypothetical protein